MKKIGLFMLNLISLNSFACPVTSTIVWPYDNTVYKSCPEGKTCFNICDNKTGKLHDPRALKLEKNFFSDDELVVDEEKKAAWDAEKKAEADTAILKQTRLEELKIKIKSRDMPTSEVLEYLEMKDGL